jgi:START domain.
MSTSIIKRIITFIAFTATTIAAHAQGDWKFKKESEGIKIYTKEAPSGPQLLKAELTVKGTPEKLIAILLDIPGQKDWVYSTKSSSLLKQLGPQELIYYTEKTMPWPVQNRDAVMYLKIQQHPQTGVVTLTSKAMPNHIPAKNGLVRVPASTVSWVVKPTGNNTMHITYEVMADPGGTVPTWVINMFITKGPLETFRKMRKLLEG